MNEFETRNILQKSTCLTSETLLLLLLKNGVCCNALFLYLQYPPIEPLDIAPWGNFLDGFK